MSLLKFLSREKLVEYLDEELRIFLNHREIYEIDQYGWLADNRPDPDYLGLAMWQTEPPAHRHEISDLCETPVNPVFQQANIDRIIKNGRQFEGLMKSGRHSIGLSHLYHENPDKMSPCFGFHFSETAMKLTMAAERLRDLFIDAFTGLPGFAAKKAITSMPSEPAEQLLSFCLPFVRARDILAGNQKQNRELLDCLTALPSLIERIYLYRDSQHPVPDGAADVEVLIDWYKLTINTANKVFLAEYLLRNAAQTPKLGHIVESL
jgi:hypothetical protein